MHHVNRNEGASLCVADRLEARRAGSNRRIVGVARLALRVEADGGSLTALRTGVEREACGTTDEAGTGERGIVQAVEIAVGLSIGGDASAVERVEVLTDGAGVIGAEGGAAGLSRGIKRVARWTALRSSLSRERGVEALSGGGVKCVAWVADGVARQRGGGGDASTGRVADLDRAAGSVGAGAGHFDHVANDLAGATKAGRCDIVRGAARDEE